MYRFFLILCVMSLVGCGPAGVGPGDIRLKRPVTTNEVVGVWKLRDECLVWLRKTGDYSAASNTVHEIEIRPEGTCRFRSILQHPSDPNEYVDYEGTWRLETDKENFSTLRLGLDETRRYGIWLDFTYLFDELELFEYWGDPDACEILRFAKKRGEPDGAANGSQPIRSETNSTPSAAGSRR